MFLFSVNVHFWGDKTSKLYVDLVAAEAKWQRIINQQIRNTDKQVPCIEDNRKLLKNWRGLGGFQVKDVFFFSLNFKHNQNPSRWEKQGDFLEEVS